MTLVVLGVVALITVAIVTYNERQRVERLRQQWDKVYLALKGKVRPEDRIAAYESLAETLKGSPAHACVLMELGRLQFDEAINAAKLPEDRKAALDKATELFKLVATTEPYSSNPEFGPLAVDGYATALEQAGNYDAAISLLEDNLPKLDKQSHFLYTKLAAQLGRVYWLRSKYPTVDEASKQPKSDPAKDGEKAREVLSEVLRVSASREERSKWREQAEYIKSLVEKRGKALPEGTPVPPVKPPAPPTPPATPGKAAPKPDQKAEPKKDEAKKEEPKKDEAKKEDAKKDEPKKN